MSALWRRLLGGWLDWFADLIPDDLFDVDLGDDEVERVVHVDIWDVWLRRLIEDEDAA